MKIAISGASGFIGSNLCTHLQDKGYEIIALDREKIKNQQVLHDIISDCDVVINLAGESIAKRWSRKNKKRIYNSRIYTTRKIVNAINLNNHTKLLISTSAIGYYPPNVCADEEYKGRGSTFLSCLCWDWEREATNIRIDMRVAITRFGLVLDHSGGAYKNITRFAELGLAVIFGNGKQPFSWISLTDLCRAMELIIIDENLNGVYNFTAPSKDSHLSFTDTVCKFYNSLKKIKIPALIMRLIMGKSSSVLIEGQSVIPNRLVGAGFVFSHPTIADFLKAVN